ESAASDSAPGPEATPEPVPSSGAPDLERVIELWPSILDQMRQVGAGMLSAVVGVARPTDLDAETGTLTIAFPPGSAFNRRKADDKDIKVVVAEAISTVVGAPLRPAFTMLDAEPEVETAPEAGAPSGAARTADP